MSGEKMDFEKTSAEIWDELIDKEAMAEQEAAERREKAWEDSNKEIEKEIEKGIEKGLETLASIKTTVTFNDKAVIGLVPEGAGAELLDKVISDSMAHSGFSYNHSIREVLVRAAAADKGSIHYADAEGNKLPTVEGDKKMPSGTAKIVYTPSF